jgi:tetratricopeptide (TPR) repeat protein
LRALVGLAAASLALGNAPGDVPVNASKAKFEEARALLASGRSTEAIPILREATRLDPKNAAAHNALGSVLNSSGQYAEALPHAEAAVALDPANGRYRYNRGVVRAEHGRFAEAIADFDAALAAHADLTYAWLERGAAKLSLGDREGARRDWEAAGNADPKLIWTQWYRATGDFVEGRYVEAAKGFDRVAESEPGFAPAKLWQALAHGRAGATVVPSEPDGSDWPAPVIRQLLGKMSAEQLLQEAAKDRISGDRRRVAEAHFFLAQQALIRNDRSVAIGHLEKALAIQSPRHVWRIAAERDLRLLESGR